MFTDNFKTENTDIFQLKTRFLGKIIFFLLLFPLFFLHATLVKGSEKPRSAAEALKSAVAKENLELVQKLLAEGADPKWFDNFNVCHAVELGKRVEILEALLKSGGDPNAFSRGVKSWPVLAWAVRNRSFTFVECLLKNGANPNLFVSKGVSGHYISPYHVAIVEGNKEIIALLEANGAFLTPDLKGKHVDFCIQDQVWEILTTRSLLTKNPVRSMDSFLAPHGDSPDDFVRRKNGFLILTRKLFEEYLANSAFSAGERKKQLQKCLAMSLNGLDIEMAELFLSLGGKIDSELSFILNEDYFFSNEAKAEAIVQKGFVQYLDFLASQGVAIDVLGKDQYYGVASFTFLLQIAAMSMGDTDQVRLAECLVKRGASVRSADAKGNTPLHYAAQRGDVGLVKLFLEFGADPNTVNKKGQTPLDSALDGTIERNKRQLVSELLSGKGGHTGSHMMGINLTYPNIVLIISVFSGFLSLLLLQWGQPGNFLSMLSVSLAGLSWWTYLGAPKYMMPYGAGMGLSGFGIIQIFAMVSAWVGYKKEGNWLGPVGCFFVLIPVIIAIALPFGLILYMILTGGSLHQ